MDGSVFDAFSRLLGSAGSRRRVLTALGAMLGPLGWQGGPDFAQAKKRKKKHKKRGGTTSPPPTPTSTITCPTGYTACGEQCFDLTDNPSNCGACAVVCSPGKTCCNGVCVDLLDNDSNCGTCGHACLTRDEDTPRINAAEICSAGACVECSFAGFIEEGDPRICCRGLTLCPATATLPAKCVAAGTACP